MSGRFWFPEYMSGRFWFPGCICQVGSGSLDICQVGSGSLDICQVGSGSLDICQVGSGSLDIICQEYHWNLCQVSSGYSRFCVDGFHSFCTINARGTMDAQIRNSVGMNIVYKNETITKAFLNIFIHRLFINAINYIN